MEPVPSRGRRLPARSGGAPDLPQCRICRDVRWARRLRSPMTHELAETMPRWARSLAPIAEHVAHAFGRAIAGKYQPASPLTRDRTRAAQAVVMARRAAAQSAAMSSGRGRSPLLRTLSPVDLPRLWRRTLFEPPVTRETASRNPQNGLCEARTAQSSNPRQVQHRLTKDEVVDIAIPKWRQGRRTGKHFRHPP
jgi:hypothetical protein